ncbi:hypothetical protein [Methanolobus sp.]|uniref:hypothetical protein n=1 Tax=Methanolobus sp. TaxID=1874737 RepID=UPI0025F2FAB3|nr:hypothetical protein [Methanolobus sp.]
MKNVKIRPCLFPGVFSYFESGRFTAIPTILTDKEVKDTFIAYGQKMHNYNGKKRKIQIRNNFFVVLSTHKISEKKHFKLQFIKYNNYQFIWLMPIHTLILFLPISFVAMIILILLATSIMFLLIRAYEKIVLRSVNYSKEANQIFLEICNAIRENEIETYGQCIRD